MAQSDFEKEKELICEKKIPFVLQRIFFPSKSDPAILITSKSQPEKCSCFFLPIANLKKH